MDHKPPPSPAPSMPDGLLADSGHLTHHDDAISYPRGDFALDAFHHHLSQPASRYPSPVPTQPLLPSPYYDPAMQYVQHTHGMPYGYPNNGSIYPPPPAAQAAATPTMYALHTPAASPATGSQQPDGRCLRSRTISRASIAIKSLPVKSGRIEKPASKKKKEKVKAPAANVPRLDGPLSEVTKGWTVPVVDIEAYVNRSLDERRMEVELGKNPGKVKRPMNAFMLYRKAYQNRAKQWCLQNNHQIVSQVCGASWPLEPEQLRIQFDEWGKLERANHQRAHPGYKFTPAKPRKKAGPKEDMDDAGSDGDEWGSNSKKRSPARRPKVSAGDDNYRTTRSSVHTQAQIQAHAMAPAPAPAPTPAGGEYAAYQQSAFHHSNAGRQIPAPYDQHSFSINGLYYQQTAQPGMQVHVEEAAMHKTPSPAPSYLSNPADTNIGLQGQYAPAQEYHHGYHHDHYHQPQEQEQQQEQGQGMKPDHDCGPSLEQQHSIDPTLLPSDDLLFDPGRYDPAGLLDGPLDGLPWPSPPPPSNLYGSPFAEGYAPYDEQAMQVLQGNKESWEVDTRDADGENWMEFPVAESA